eukprot:13552874-Alexandrium_andersonii.AAC.1
MPSKKSLVGTHVGGPLSGSAEVHKHQVKNAIVVHSIARSRCGQEASGIRGYKGGLGKCGGHNDQGHKKVHP